MESKSPLQNFKKLSNVWLIGAIVALVIGFFIAMSSNVSIGYSDGYTSYSTLQECEDANYDFEEMCASEGSVVNPGSMAASYVFFAIFGVLANLFVIGKFLIMTSESIIHGLGGKLD